MQCPICKSNIKGNLGEHIKRGHGDLLDNRTFFSKMFLISVNLTQLKENFYVST